MARVGRADRWEMSLDRNGPYHPKLEEKWEAPRFDDIHEELAILASAESQTSHMLLTVRSREIERYDARWLKCTHGDKRNTVRAISWPPCPAHLESGAGGRVRGQCSIRIGPAEP